MERLVETLGVTKLSKSQVSIMAKELDEAVEAFRTRPLDAGPYTFLAADALVLKVREAGRVVGVHTLIATGVNAEGYREILGIQVTSAEDGAGWLAFFRDLVARGLSGVALVTSDAHAGLVAAIGATLPAAAWQRCRTHYAANLMAATPKPSWPWVRTLLHSIYDQPDAESVVAATPTPAWWPRSAPPCPQRPGSAAEPTTQPITVDTMHNVNLLLTSCRSPHPPPTPSASTSSSTPSNGCTATCWTNSATPSWPPSISAKSPIT